MDHGKRRGVAASASLALPLIVMLLHVAPCRPQESSSLLFQLKSQPSQFHGFRNLLEHAGLISELEDAIRAGRSLTIFAPSDVVLTQRTSPTLLAFLKLEENKAALRRVLLSHIVPKPISPFEWEGVHRTMGNTNLHLSMDAQAFYAGSQPVVLYNSVVAPDGVLHSMPTLLVPADIGFNRVSEIVSEGAEVRRVLQATAKAPTAAAAPKEQGPPRYGNFTPISSSAPTSATFCFVSTLLGLLLALTA